MDQLRKMQLQGLPPEVEPSTSGSVDLGLEFQRSRHIVLEIQRSRFWSRVPEDTTSVYRPSGHELGLQIQRSRDHWSTDTEVTTVV